MAANHILLLTILVISCLATKSLSSSFDDENPIRLISDSLHDIESHVVSVLGHTRRALSFAHYIHRYGKKYESVGEMKMRYEVYKESLKLVRSTNSKELSYKLHLNKFADWTWEEFSAHQLGAAQNCSATLKGSHKLSHATAPAEKDWRTEGIVSPVKNQGDCGSCWTFSTTGALEAAYAQKHGKSISLSEQQLVDCAGAFNNFGCNGGLPSQAFEYIKYNGGLDTEEAYPYQGKNGACSFSSNDVGVKVVDSVNITLGAEDELKDAVAFVRPVSVAFQVAGNFRLYESGVFSYDACGNTPMDVNHAVLAVGYGVENEVPYWLIKNSWGEDWGDNGYFKMEMGKNMCGIATCASYPVVE